MIIDCISDLHGYYPKLEGGDLLVIAGDLTARDSIDEHVEFCEWLDVQPYRKKIVIAGNHDNNIDADYIKSLRETRYLEDSETEFEGLKIWGSPWTLKFQGMNPKCMAFTCDIEDELSNKFSLISEDIDILITHSPPYGILDYIPIEDGSYYHAGSKSLALKIGHFNTPPKLWVFGHIHEAYGEDLAIRQKSCKMINCSYVNQDYEPVNKPIRVIL